ncbi:hypothetical protein E8E68_13680 [Pseudomonas sp. BN607]|nr:hypothetical protein [Pseudomonas sp. BN607]
MPQPDLLRSRPFRWVNCMFTRAICSLLVDSSSNNWSAALHCAIARPLQAGWSRRKTSRRAPWSCLVTLRVQRSDAA